MEEARSDAQLHRRLGLAHRKSNQEREAITALTRALELDPKLVDVEGPLGELHRAAAREAKGAGDAEDYAKELESARRFVRDDADLCAEHANALRSLQRHAQAAEAARRAHELAPDRVDLSRLLGELCEAAGDHEGARAAFARVVQAQADRFDAQLGLGRALSRLGKMRDAIEPLGRAVALSPEDGTALELLGLAQLHEESYADARDTFGRLAKLRPLDALPLRRLAECQIALGDDEAARTTLATLTRLVPTDRDALATLAGCEERLGRIEESVASFERLLEAEPERSAARRSLTLSYARLSRHDDVIRSAKIVLKNKPDDVEVLFALASSYAATQRTEETLETASTLVRVVPEHLAGLRLVAGAAVTLGREDLAMSTLERARVLPSAPPEVRTELEALVRARAERQEASNDLAAALAGYQRARGLAPDDPSLPLAIARCQHALGKAQEALETLRENLRTHTDHAGSWLLLGRLYDEGGYAREASEAYRKALARESSFEALAGLGFACAEIGLVDDAIDALSRASRERPSDVRVRTKLAALHDGSGRSGDAIQSLSDLRGLRELTVDENRRLGLLFAAAAKHEEAIEPLSKALAAARNDAALLEPLATAFEALGRDEEAAAMLARLVTVSASHPDAASRLGFAQARLGRHTEAAAAFEVARSRETPRASVLTALAAEYEVLGDDASRRSALEALVQLVPTDAPAQRALGFAYEAANLRDRAIEALTRADVLSNSEDGALRRKLAELHLARASAEDLGLARTFAAGDAALLLSVARAFVAGARTREAVETAREVLRLSPKSLDAALLVGDVLTSDGDAAGAAKAYEHALQHRLDAVDALFGVARAYVTLGRPGDAVNMLQRAARLAPAHVEVHRLLATTLAGLGDKEAALTAYSDLVAIAPDADALLAEGRLAASLGRNEEARESLERAAELRGNDHDILLELADVRAKLGLGAESLEAAEELSRAAPTDARAMRRLGEAYAAVDRPDDAIDALERAIALDGSVADVRETLGKWVLARAMRLQGAPAARDFERAMEL
ncbi:MAG: tetratricopeptide repeat protein, partial [Polyangiales bacterium]